MPWDKAWPPPSTAALDLIERVYRLANTLRVMEINPGAVGLAVLVDQGEALALLDHLRSPWKTAVWGEGPEGSGAPDVVELDLYAPLRPGLKWGLLFGITLIIDEEGGRDTPHDS